MESASRRSRPPQDSLSATGKLPREARVRHRRDFQRIQKRGIRVHTAAFSVVAAAGRDTGRARIGCAVSRRVGNAVVRSRVRRLIREVFRRVASELPATDIVVIAKPPAGPLARAGFGPVADMLVPAIRAAARRGIQVTT